MVNSNSISTPEQLGLDLQIVAEAEHDGVGMGVLSDGTAFLTLRGLSRLCGADIAAIVRITNGWLDTPLKPREKKIRELVRSAGYDDSVAFYGVIKAGTVHHAVPAHVCMAVLEYYAFEASGDSSHALNSFRVLAKKGLEEFVYARVGYNPSNNVSLSWRQFHDRVSLVANAVPAGYFSIYQEIAGMIVPMINAGIDVGPQIVPDISVGIRWSKHWQSESLEILYGARKTYLHDFPLYFPQALSNPQKPYCYPDEALGEFRKWFRATYLEKYLPDYLKSQAKLGKVKPAIATKAIEAFMPKAIKKA